MKWYLISFLLLPFVSLSQLQVPAFFSNNMMLQRDAPIHLWGRDLPGRKVKASFAGSTKETLVLPDSSWSIYLKKQKANARPQNLIISDGQQSLVFSNILVGDVWVASGQSNMEWPLSREMHWKEERKNSDQPLMRFVNPPPAGRNVYGVAYNDSLNSRLNTHDFYRWEKWQACDSNSAGQMSAVAYYFAKAIVEKQKVPIGFINLSIGGAPIETFISREAMQKSSRFSSKVQGDWLEDNSLPEWVRQRGKENVGDNAVGFKDDLGLNHAYKPGFAFESGVKPLLPMAVKGVIWYQGESNALEKARVEEYRDLLHLLIDDYRKKWNQPAMPFYWVQLSSIDTVNYKSQYWPQFRDEQRKLLFDVNYGGMAVCSDIGFKDNVHPTNKKTVGERLARWALRDSYKEAIVPSGPLPKKAQYSNGMVTVSFHYGKGLATSDDKPLRGFSIDGKTEVKAFIDKDKVIIEAKEKPELLYYGWKPYTDANLVNAENLPASTFKIDVQ